MEVCCLLSIELTPDCAAVLSGAKSLEAVIDQLGILFMKVFMGHDIRGAGVHLAAAHLQSEIQSNAIKKPRSGPAADMRVSVCKNGFKKANF